MIGEELIVSRSNPLQRARADVATLVARFALACILVVGLLWGAFADAALIAVCSTEAPEPSCPDVQFVDDTTVSVGAVFVCRGFPVDVGDGWAECVDGEAFAGRWTFVDELIAGDMVWFDAGYQPVEFAAFWDGGGDPPSTGGSMAVGCPGVLITGPSGEALCQDGEGGIVEWVQVESQPWVPELSVEQAMQIFGAVLLLWAVAYAGRILRQTMEGKWHA